MHVLRASSKITANIDISIAQSLNRPDQHQPDDPLTHVCVNEWSTRATPSKGSVHTLRDLQFVSQIQKGLPVGVDSGALGAKAACEPREGWHRHPCLGSRGCHGQHYHLSPHCSLKPTRPPNIHLRSALSL